MSYILDALRKSERERALGAVPDLDTVQQERSKVRVNRWPWLAGALLVLNVAIGIAFVVKEPATVVVAESSNTVEAEIRVPVAPETPASVDEALAPVSEPAAEPRRATLAAQDESPPASAADTAVAQTSLAKVEALDIQPPENTTTLVESVSEVSSSYSAEPEPAATDWMDMPADFRARVSRPDIDVHVYSDDPARRFVLIDLRKYREGERIESGLEIDSITQGGVVFSDHGTRFQVKRP